MPSSILFKDNYKSAGETPQNPIGLKYNIENKGQEETR